MKSVQIVSFACLLLGASTLQATPIYPGQTVVPEELPNPGDDEDEVVIGDTEGSFSFPLGSGGVFSGTYEQGVGRLGLFCADCLTFFYRVDVGTGSAASLTTVGGGGFAGFDTSISWIRGGDEQDQIDGKPPIDALRSGDGANVLFTFARQGNLSNLVTPGGQTAYLAISTNATAFDRNGVLGVIGANPNGSFLGLINGVYGPATAVPEPASLALLGTGIAGMFMARRRKKGKLAA